MGIFRGFLRSKERFIIYRKLPYFECQFGGFLGEELGEGVSPKWCVKVCLILLGKGEKFACRFWMGFFGDFLQMTLGDVDCYILSEGEMGLVDERMDLYYNGCERFLNLSCLLLQ